ncbi:MAG: PadR family transcriptional regulator [Candidatus Bathyarchaeota archaeon]|jgi:DNA-binding PadR family transcriptional regulator|nr:PadR family transcriptional regulator [Candidatus Bathyarchaeota archaeon]
MKHTAMVPKGFIRFHVLEALSQKPMSGSEIMNEISNRTDGCWKPSPGSIYPLLAWLQDNGYVEELPSDQSGLKRYKVTESGKAFLNEQRKMRASSTEEAKLFPPPFMGALWFRIPSHKTVKLRRSMRKLMVAFFRLGNELEETFSQEAMSDAQRLLDETAEKLNEIGAKLRG